jgi:hypothetical protein
MNGNVTRDKIRSYGEIKKDIEKSFRGKDVSRLIRLIQKGSVSNGLRNVLSMHEGYMAEEEARALGKKYHFRIFYDESGSIYFSLGFLDNREDLGKGYGRKIVDFKRKNFSKANKAVNTMLENLQLENVEKEPEYIIPDALYNE